MAQETKEKREGGDLLELLKRLKSEVYYDENEALALGLGRTTEEVEAWLGGEEDFDEDAEMKINKLADERLGE